MITAFHILWRSLSSAVSYLWRGNTKFPVHYPAASEVNYHKYDIKVYGGTSPTPIGIVLVQRLARFRMDGAFYNDTCFWVNNTGIENQAAMKASDYEMRASLSGNLFPELSILTESAAFGVWHDLSYLDELTFSIGKTGSSVAVFWSSTAFVRLDFRNKVTQDILVSQTLELGFTHRWE